MSGRFNENPAFVEYERLTLRLHDLIRAGQGESDEADETREKMDGSWKRLDRAERDRLDGLSIDLSQAMAEPPKTLDPGIATSAASLDHARAVAYSRREWSRFLQLIRQGPTGLDHSFAMFARARAYQELGQLDIALLFMKKAAELNPKDNYKSLHLELLREMNQFGEAVPLAEQYIADKRSGPGLLTMAAGVLFASTRSLAEDAAVARYEEAAQALTRALAPENEPALKDPDVRVAALVLLGLCNESLDRTPAAEAAYDAALRLNPSSQVAGAAKAWLAQQRKQHQVSPEVSVSSKTLLRERRYQLAEQAGMYLQAA